MRAAPRRNVDSLARTSPQPYQTTVSRAQTSQSSISRLASLTAGFFFLVHRFADSFGPVARVRAAGPTPRFYKTVPDKSISRTNQGRRNVVPMEHRERHRKPRLSFAIDVTIVNA